MVKNFELKKESGIFEKDIRVCGFSSTAYMFHALRDTVHIRKTLYASVKRQTTTRYDIDKFKIKKDLAF